MSAENTRRFQLALIYLPQSRHQRAHHQRRKDGNLRQNHAVNRIEEVYRRQFKSKQRHQGAVEQPRRAVNKGERESDKKGRQRNKSINDPAHQLAAGERNKHQNQRQHAAEHQTAKGSEHRNL